MRKTVNIVKKMRTTNCKISIFCSVSSIFTLFLMCVSSFEFAFYNKNCYYVFSPQKLVMF